MNSLKLYNDHKLAIKNANHWAGLIGKKYNGGGGGTGNIASLTISTRIYHQEYDGATNYHEIPEVFGKYLAKTVLKNFDKLKQEALDLMEADRLDLARKTEEEHKFLMKEAGLMV